MTAPTGAKRVGPASDDEEDVRREKISAPLHLTASSAAAVTFSPRFAYHIHMVATPHIQCAPDQTRPYVHFVTQPDRTLAVKLTT